MLEAVQITPSRAQAAAIFEHYGKERTTDDLHHQIVAHMGNRISNTGGYRRPTYEIRGDRRELKERLGPESDVYNNLVVTRRLVPTKTEPPKKLHINNQTKLIVYGYDNTVLLWSTLLRNCNNATQDRSTHG